MAQASFPGPERDGAQPPASGVPARDTMPCGPEDDWDADAEMARFLAAVEAGRERIPEEWEVEGPACSISLGDACDVDPAELAAMTGPDGLAQEGFTQAAGTDVLRPGPVLAALTEQAVRDVSVLSDNQLLGAMSAIRRLRNRADYLETVTVAEFTRRQAAQYEASKARRDPRGCRDGEFADAELAMQFVTSIDAASDLMVMAADLTSRLPHTLAGLAAGTIDGGRAAVIWRYTRCLSDEHAAQADEILAAAAPGLRHDRLARKAAALEMRLDPDGVKRRKEEARQQGQRVEARREPSGNASLAGRELATEDVLASKAHIDALAVALRNGGLDGSLRQLRVIAYLDLTQGRNPLDRLTRARPDQAGAPSADGGNGADGNTRHHATGGDEDDGDGSGEDHEGDDGGGDGGPGSGPQGPGTPAGGPAPLPALINLIVPAGTLLGWSGTPAGAGAWGLLDAGDTRTIVQAASAHPRSRWCVTITGPDGTAMAHGCARGQHPWIPPPAAGPDAQRAARLADLIRQLNVTFAPIAKGSCDHRHQEDRYTPSRELKHLVRARTATCSAPGCGAQAYYCDLDHSVPYPAGLTCECGLAPVCRRHHRCKQAPGWRLEQPAPGIMHWTTPSGRAYTTTPTGYDQ